MKYVCETRALADHWYPKDIMVRSKIDEYMSWHHTNLRIGAAFTFRELVKGYDPLSANPTKWPSTLKQFVCKLPTNCLTVFDHFKKWVLKGLISKLYEVSRLKNV